MSSVNTIFEAASIIPVLTVERIADAVPLAKALYSGGLKVIEMTLRTDDALAIMKEMKSACPDLLVGMGTIRSTSQIDASVEAGADFLVSPGLTPELGAAMIASGCAALPGVATAGEAMRAFDQGFRGLKFFPAEAAGGIDYLKSLSGPLPDLRFCPTGGISKDRAVDYLALPNVGCVGGSWIAPPSLINAGDWRAISYNSQLAAELKALSEETRC